MNGFFTTLRSARCVSIPHWVLVRNQSSEEKFVPPREMHRAAPCSDVCSIDSLCVTADYLARDSSSPRYPRCQGLGRCSSSSAVRAELQASADSIQGRAAQRPAHPLQLRPRFSSSVSRAERMRRPDGWKEKGEATHNVPKPSKRLCSCPPIRQEIRSATEGRRSRVI